MRVRCGVWKRVRSEKGGDARRQAYASFSVQPAFEMSRRPNDGYAMIDRAQQEADPWRRGGYGSQETFAGQIAVTPPVASVHPRALSSTPERSARTQRQATGERC